MGTRRGLEADVVPRQGLEFRTVEVEGLPRRLSLTLPRSLFRLLKGYRQARTIIKEFEPAVVVGTGGFVAAPVVFAASSRKVPILIHEQNSVPGLTNRWAARVADKIAVTFPESAAGFAPRPVTVTGNPVRQEILEETGDGFELFDLERGRKTLLVFGGSRGAQHINDAVLEGLPRVADLAWLQILHAAGKMDFERVRHATRGYAGDDAGLRYRCVPYVEEMGKAYRTADLVVSRAGATTIAEVTTLGVASILVPYPYATASHQELNARYVEKAGGAKVIPDRELSGDTLFSAVLEVLGDPAKLESMRQASKRFGKPHAAEDLAGMVFELMEKG